jgi:hypothetical protein
MTTEGRPFAIDVSLVECVVVVVPHVESLGGIAGALAELVGDRTIRVLDLVLVVKNSTSGEIAALGPETSDAASFRGLVDERIGNLLSENDINFAAASLLPGAAGVLVLIEDRWATALSSAALRAGGRVVGGVRIPQARIESALQAPRVAPASTPVKVNHREDQR